jgi:hypothetical protein
MYRKGPSKFPRDFKTCKITIINIFYYIYIYIFLPVLLGLTLVPCSAYGHAIWGTGALVGRLRRGAAVGSHGTVGVPCLEIEDGRVPSI